MRSMFVYRLLARLFCVCGGFLYVILFLLAFPSFAQDIRLDLSADLVRTAHPPALSPGDSLLIVRQIDDWAPSLYHSNPDSALFLLEDAYERSAQLGFEYGIQKSKLALGVMFSGRGNYAKADSLFQQTYSFCQELGGKYPAIWHNNVGMLRLYEGQFDESYLHFDSAMAEISRRNEQHSELASMIYGNVGSLFKILNDSEKAIFYCQKSLDIAVQLKDSVRMCAAYNNLGSAYARKGDRIKAIECYERVVALARKINKHSSLQIAYLNLGEVYWTNGQNDLALRYLHQSIQLSGQQNPYHSIATPALYLSQVYLEQQQYDSARRYAERAIAASDSINALGILPAAYAVLSRVDFIQGRYKDAYLNLRTHLSYFDSNMNLEKQKAIHQLETAYRTAEKDNEIIAKQLLLAQKEQAIQRKNYLIGLIGTGSALIGMIVYFNYRHRKKMEQARWLSVQKDREIMRYKSIIEGEEKERTRLANELHDGIISQLTAVKVRLSGLLQQDGPIDRSLFQEGFQYLEETMNDLRMTAHNLMPETVARRGLAGALQEFCRKLENEHGTRIHLIINNSRPLPKDIELSVYRIVQELVQNALKHASAENLIVQIHYFDTLLSITVEDDGVGFDPSDPMNGAGLNNVRERAMALEGQFQIDSVVGSGTTAYLEIPIEKSYKFV